MIKPYSLITAIGIVCVAVGKCRVERNVFHGTILFLGMTSVYHHSRLDRWWINDWIRAVDNLAVVSAFLTGIACLKNETLLKWLIVQVYGLLVLSLIASEAVFRPTTVPIAHASVHVALLLFLTCCDTTSGQF